MTDLIVILLPPLLLLLGSLLPHRRIPADRLLVAGSVVFLIPFALAVLCCFPCLDDWAYGASGRAGWWEAQRAWYAGWSGRISATAAASGWGAIGSPWFSAVVGYRLALIGLLAALAFAVRDLLHAAMPRAGGYDRALAWCAVAAGWIAAMPDPTEGLYWLNGAVTYTLGMAVALVVVSSTLRALDGEGAWRWRLAAILAMPAALFSEVVSAMLCTALALLCLRGGPGIQRWRCLAVAALAGAGTLLLLSAPGNGVRLAVAMGEGLSPPSADALGLAGRVAGMLWGQLASGAFTVLFACAAVIPGRAVDAADAPPSFGWMAGILVPLAGMLPMAWVGMGPPRAWNTVFLVVAIGVVVVARTLACRPWAPSVWLLLAGASLLSATAKEPGSIAVLLLGWLVAAAVLWLRRDRVARSSRIALAACSLLLGAQLWWGAVGDVLWKGPGYVAEQQGRLDRLARLAPGSHARVPLLSGDLPYLYHREDVHIAADTWQNRGMAAFFGMDSIRATTDPAAVSEPAR